MSDSGSYYIPHGSKWPIIASIAVCTAMVGGSTLLNGNPSGKYILFVGLALIVYMMVGWFSTVISESEEGLYDAQVDTSFRMGMMVYFFRSDVFCSFFWSTLLCKGLFSSMAWW